jgi:hypothetical protein
MSRYREQVAAALGAVTILGSARYAWLGRGSRPIPSSLDAELSEDERRAYLLSCLREELYCSFYCHGRPVPARWGEPEPPFADPWLAAALSHANTGDGSWEPGWTVQRLNGEEAVVANGRLRARVPMGDCKPPADTVAPGATVSVRLPKELPELSPGFYTAVGDVPADLASSGIVVRVYWNITAAGASELVRTLTSQLNLERAPFRLKVADHPFRLTRCDAAVLYVRGDNFQALRETLQGVASMLSAHLRPQIPAFTRELAPGVGLAEDSGESESFGERRCALLADGILRAHERGILQADSQLDAVAARFAEDGVQIDAPYLEPSLGGRHVL